MKTTTDTFPSFEPELFSGDVFSPSYVRTHTETSRDPASDLLHSHDFFELAYVRKGHQVAYQIGGIRYTLREGDILTIPPGVIHGPVSSAEPRPSLTREVVWISQHLMNHFTLMTPGKQFYEIADSKCFSSAGTQWEFLGELFQRNITEQERQQFGWERVQLGNTVQLVTQLCRAMMESGILMQRDEKPELLFLIMDYVECHLPEKLTLEAVAQHFEVSTSTVTQTFRKRIGKSFYSYVIGRRLLLARNLIEQNVKLETVGKSVGFAEHSAFYRAFKKAYGVSPKEYRNQYFQDSSAN